MTQKARRQELELRTGIVAACRHMNAIGLNQGTSGNISARFGDRMLITPSGVPYHEMAAEDLAIMPIDGDYGSWEGSLAPSTEWRFHLDITRARPEVGAIVHAHSTFATAIAIARKDIPACHYMIAAAGGPSIRCARYATYGTKELSAAALRALEDRNACLLANHGMIATGPTLGKAMWLAAELETIARQYVISLSIGGPVLLSDAEIAKVKEDFKSYGPHARGEADVDAAATPAKAKAKGTKKATSYRC
jgi:L-fuculose-phosphate aldolase